MSHSDDFELETFENPHPDANYTVNSVTDEFTCVCPVTGQPDFARIRVRYVPGPRCFELKSFKLFLWSFRNEGHFHEDVTNRILNKLSEVCFPIWMEVIGEFNTRGGIATTVSAQTGARPSWCVLPAPSDGPNQSQTT